MSRLIRSIIHPFWKQKVLEHILDVQENVLNSNQQILSLLEQKESNINNHKAVILDMKMSATNALAEIWLSDPKKTIEEQNKMMIECLKIIQARGLDI